MCLQNRVASEKGRKLHFQISKLKGALTSHVGLSGRACLERLRASQNAPDNPRLLKYLDAISCQGDLPEAFDAYNERLQDLK